jgi:hypothetical protein
VLCFSCPGLLPDLIKPFAESIKEGAWFFIYKHPKIIFRKHQL